jgi:predicted permease
MRRGVLQRLVLRLAPRHWRETVRDDLDEEARASGHGSAWIAWQTFLAAGRMRAGLGGDAMTTDLRYVCRSLWHAKGFTLAAVLTLVLGIGVNLAVFTIVDRALFRPLPYFSIDRLVMVTPYSWREASRAYSFNKRLFIESRRSLPGLQDLAYIGFAEGYASRTPHDSAATLWLCSASYNILDVLGAPPALGRGFSRADAESRERLALITYDVWQSHFGGSGDALGMWIGSGKSVYRIAGVLPRGFYFRSIGPATSAGQFDGLVLAPDLLESAGPREGTPPALARLKPGVSLSVAQQQFDALSARLDAEFRTPNQPEGPSVLVEPLRAGMFANTYRYLWLLAIGASFVGLLACANLSNLLLARGRSRERQLALQVSLGASTGRIAAAELAQGLIICGLAAAVSLLILYWMAEGLRALVPTAFRQIVIGGIDARVVGLAALASVAAALLAALWPAWRASRTSLLAVLQRGAGAPSHAWRRPGKVVLVFEATIGVILVAGAAVAARSFIGLLTTDVGFVRPGLEVVRVEPAGNRSGDEGAAQFARYRGMLDVLRRQPGVAAAAGVDVMPAGTSAPRMGLQVQTAEGTRRSGLWQVTDGFFTTVGARLVAGRDITATDIESGQPVAVISRAAARAFWPDAPELSVIGREIVAAKQPDRRVIGIVDDVRDRPDEPAPPRVFIPITAEGFWALELAVRTAGSPLNGESLRRVLAEPFGVTRVTVMPAGSRITGALQPPRVQALMFGSFALIALLLAALGLFAVASFDVALRCYEMGIRAAMGASAAQIRSLVIRDALRPVAIGIALGLGIAYWSGQFLQSLVHGVDARDLGTLALVAGTLLVTAALAAWIPARRAARTDPAVVLRTL